MIANALPKSLIDNPRLDTWIGFEVEGEVRLATGKIEIGQGILSALTQIAAEELDVAPARIRIQSGDTRSSPAEGFTSGSNSVTVTGSAVRLVGAEVRALLLEEAARRLGCSPSRLSVRDGRIFLAAEDTGLDYWLLAKSMNLGRPATGTAPVKRPEDYRIVGVGVPRHDLQAKITGGAFIHDMTAPDLLHVRMLHRPWRGARLAALDEAAVRKAARAPIDILRDGDLVAFMADREPAVMRALEAARLNARWEGGDPPPDEVANPDWLQARLAKERLIEDGPDIGSPQHVFEAWFSRPFLAHGAIAPSCALARYEDGQLTVWTHSQGVFALREWLARTLGLDQAQVSVLHRQSSGCYGHNSADDAAFDAAFVATRVPGRTVRVQWAREDEMSIEPFGGATSVRVRVALSTDHRPVSWTMDIWSPVQACRPGMNGGANLLGAAAISNALPSPSPEAIEDSSEEVGGGATRNAHAFYDFPSQRILFHLLADFPVRTSSLRGLGAYVNVFAIESVMDELAERAGEDPVAWRLSFVSDPRARKVIETAAAMAGWFGTAPGEGRALGLGFARYKNRAAYMAAVAEVEVEEAVRVSRIWAAVDAGLVINPDNARSQVEGGILQTVSWALKEEVLFRDGRVADPTWDGYPILRFSEVPEIDVRLVEAQDMPTLGIGEVAHGPTAAAIGNAVARALGQRICDLPLTRERVMNTLLAQ